MGAKTVDTSNSQSNAWNPTSYATTAYTSALNNANLIGNQQYNPYNGQLVAGMNQTQTTAGANINDTYGMLGKINTGLNSTYAGAGQVGQTFGNLAGSAMTAGNDLSAQNFGSTIGSYMNPYIQSVIDPTMTNINTQNSLQDQGVIGSAIQAGNAFGGDRMGLGLAALANQQDLASQQTIAGLYNTGYNNATGVEEANASQQLAGVNAAGNMTAGQLQALATQNQTEALKEGAAGQQLQTAEAQLGYGTQQQQTQQARDTANYQQYQNAIAWPYQQASWYNQNLTGLGSQLGGTGSGSGTASVPDGNFGSTIFGAGLAGSALLNNSTVSSGLSSLFGGGTAAASGAASGASTIASDIIPLTNLNASGILTLGAAVGGKRGGRINGYRDGGRIKGYDNGGAPMPYDTGLGQQGPQSGPGSNARWLIPPGLQAPQAHQTPRIPEESVPSGAAPTSGFGNYGLNINQISQLAKSYGISGSNTTPTPAGSAHGGRIGSFAAGGMPATPTSGYGNFGLNIGHEARGGRIGNFGDGAGNVYAHGGRIGSFAAGGMTKAQLSSIANPAPAASTSASATPAPAPSPVINYSPGTQNPYWMNGDIRGQGPVQPPTLTVSGGSSPTTAGGATSGPAATVIPLQGPIGLAPGAVSGSSLQQMLGLQPSTLAMLQGAGVNLSGQPSSSTATPPTAPAARRGGAIRGYADGGAPVDDPIDLTSGLGGDTAPLGPGDWGYVPPAQSGTLAGPANDNSSFEPQFATATGTNGGTPVFAGSNYFYPLSDTGTLNPQQRGSVPISGNLGAASAVSTMGTGAPPATGSFASPSFGPAGAYSVDPSMMGSAGTPGGVIQNGNVGPMAFAGGEPQQGNFGVDPSLLAGAQNPAFPASAPIARQGSFAAAAPTPSVVGRNNLNFQTPTQFNLGQQAPTPAPTVAASTPASGSGDFYTTAMMHESGGRNIPNSGGGKAFGVYQIMPGTWSAVRSSHPELNLPPTVQQATPVQQTAAYHALTGDNIAVLSKAGVPTNDKNTFMAAFLGGGGAAKFIPAMAQNPNAPAASLFPSEARSNPTVFYGPGGVPKTLGQLYAGMTHNFSAGNTTEFGANAGQTALAYDGGRTGALNAPAMQAINQSAPSGTLGGPTAASSQSTGTFGDAATQPAPAPAPASGNGFLDKLGIHLSPQANQALLAAGLGMMASRSPHFGQGIGEGGLAGIQNYMANTRLGLEQQNVGSEVGLRGAQTQGIQTENEIKKQQLAMQRAALGQLGVVAPAATSGFTPNPTAAPADEATRLSAEVAKNAKAPDVPGSPQSGAAPAPSAPSPQKQIDPDWDPATLERKAQLAAWAGNSAAAETYRSQANQIIQSGRVKMADGTWGPLPGINQAEAQQQGVIAQAKAQAEQSARLEAASQIAEQDAQGKVLGELPGKLSDAANSAKQQNATIEEMQNASTGFRMGWGADTVQHANGIVQGLRKMVGADTSAFDRPVADYQDFVKLSTGLVRQATKETSPRAAFQELNFIERSMPSPETSQDGFGLVAGQMKGQNDYTIAKQQAGQAWSDQHSGSMRGFEADWNKNVSPAAFWFNRMQTDAPQSLAATIANLKTTDQGKGMLAHVRRELVWANSQGLFGQ